MAYQCKISNRECDACGFCAESAKSELCCSLCGRVLSDGECYYYIDGAAVCGECIRLSRRTA